MDEPGNIRITSVELLDNEPLKRFALVMPVCGEDYKLAIKTLAWACRLEAPKAGVMLLLPDNLGGNRIIVLKQLASPLADRVEVVPQLAFPGSKEWPAGPNAAFICAYNAVETYDVDAWLFWEPDSVPTKNTWTSELYKAFKESGKLVFGACIKGRPPLPSVGVNGVAVYSKALQREMINAVIDNMDKPFDVVLSRLLGPRNIGCTDLIQFRLGRNRAPLRWTEKSDINPNAVLVHTDKFGDVVNLLSTSFDSDVRAKDKPQPSGVADQKVSTTTNGDKSGATAEVSRRDTKANAELAPETKNVDQPPTNDPRDVESDTEPPEARLSAQTTIKCLPLTSASSERVFCHSGDLGDIIYSLPAIRALGGGKIVLTRCKDAAPYITREPMTKERADLIIPLLKNQPYIKDAEFADCPPKDAVMLDEFRHLIHGEQLGVHRHWRLSALHLKQCGLPTWIDSTPWLWAEPSEKAPAVVMARSLRYHNPEFPWPKIIEKYRGIAGFIGTPKEYEAFVADCGDVAYIPTKDLMEAASIIAGCSLFIGNQSAPLAIAVGMGKPAVVEFTPIAQNCFFNYEGFNYGACGPLPDVEFRPTIEWAALRDVNSGIGRWAYEVAKRFKTVLPVWVPTRSDETYGKHPFNLHESATGAKCRVVFDAIPIIMDTARDGDIVITIWESSSLPRKAVKTLNQARCVIVPSNYCRDVMVSSGVIVPVHRIDLGINTGLHKRKKPRKFGIPIVYGCAMRMSEPSQRRKMLKQIIEAFVKAFPKPGLAQLQIKGYDGPWPDLPNDSRFVAINRYLTDEEMAEWYDSLHFIVNPAPGGWELHVQEAMAHGVVPIAINYAGLREFTDDSFAFYVKHSEVLRDDDVHPKTGKWAAPDAGHLVYVLRATAELEAKEYTRRSLTAESYARRFTWDRTAAMTEDIIKAYL